VSNAETFVERFTEVWRSPQPQQFADLWHEDGTLLHPGMSQPIGGRQKIMRHVGKITQVAPDISLRPLRWAARGDDVFIEWRITATLAGEPVSWDGVDRFTLRDDRAVNGIAYFDMVPLWSRIDPAMARSTTLEEAAGAALVGDRATAD